MEVLGVGKNKGKHSGANVAGRAKASCNQH